MHATSKEVSENGSIILTSVLEGDGAVELASDKAELSAKIISVQRTISGGIQIQAAVDVKEPAPEAPAVVEAPKPEPTAEDNAAAYLQSKGQSEADAKAAVEKFGAKRILQRRADELDAELDAALKS